MIEVFPQTIRKEKFEASLQKLVSAFLMVAEDLLDKEGEEPLDHKSLNQTLTTPLTSSSKGPK